MCSSLDDFYFARMAPVYNLDLSASCIYSSVGSFVGLLDVSCAVFAGECGRAIV